MNRSDMPAPWEGLLSAEDRARLAQAGFGKRVGFGARPAVLVIDAQNYMVGPPPGSFHGTPLLGLLVDRRVDTVLITGGSTSNCVRATAVDAASHNLRTVVVADCVFDRFEISHLVSLFDLDRQYADVVGLSEAVEALRATSAGE